MACDRAASAPSPTDKVRGAAARYRERHPDRRKKTKAAWIANNREKVNAADRAWQKRNPDKVRAAKRLWRYRYPELARERCGTVLKRDNISLDHVTPFAKGGKNDMANINPVCRPCNLLKKTQLWPLRPPV